MLFITGINTAEQMQTILLDLGKQFADTIPNIIGAIIFLIIGWILAAIFSRIIRGVLETVKIDELGEKLKEVDLFKSLDFKLSSFFSKLVYWGIMLVAATAAAEMLQLKVVSEGIASLLGYIPRLLSALFFFVIGVFIANVIKQVVDAACSSIGIAAARFIGMFVFYFLVIIIAISALNQAGIGTEIIAQNVSIAIGAILFAFAIGYGIASKDIMASMLASFYGRDKFGLGETIRIGEIQGEIIKMDSTSVTLDAGDKKIVMPLSKLMNATVEVLDV